MCRRNLLVGGVLIAFGAGVLVGMCLQVCLLGFVFSFAAIVGGLFLLRMI